MARYRTIKPKFWDDEKIVKLSFEARLTFIAFWNFADDNGVIIGENVWLKSKIYPHEDIKMKKFASWIEEMLQLSLIIPVIYNKHIYYILPNFQRHQIINRPNLEDVFIPVTILNKLLSKSLNEHGCITDESMPYIRVVKRSKEEGMRPPPIDTKILIEKKLFRDCEFFDFEKFKAEFENSKYNIYNLNFYYESVLNWSDSGKNVKKDWIATARGFMLKDTQEHKAVLATDTLEQKPKGNKKDYSSLENKIYGNQ